jgi:hypothetical protein
MSSSIRTQYTPYSDPYEVLSWTEKTMQLLMCGRPVTLSTDDVKLAYMRNKSDHGKTTFNPAVNATPAAEPPAALPQPVKY